MYKCNGVLTPWNCSLEHCEQRNFNKRLYEFEVLVTVKRYRWVENQRKNVAGEKFDCTLGRQKTEKKEKSMKRL